MKSVNRAVLTSMFDKVCKEKYIAVVLSIFALVITSVNFWTTNKGIFIRDEGWLNLLVNNCPNDNVSTQFYFYLKNCFDGDLLLNRLVCLSVHILSAAFFAWAIFYYYKCRLNLTKWSFLTITSLSIMGISIANIIACFVFGYILMDVQIAMISTALLLISLQVNSSRLSDFLVLICGIVCGNLAFVMITNMMMPISIFVFLLFVKDKRYQSLLFVFGILLSVVLFFTMFYPYNLSDYLDGLKSNIDATINNKFVSQHGMKAMIVWMINALVFFVSKAFPLILVYIAAVSVYFKRKVTKICFIVFLALCIIVYMWINIVNPCGRVETIAPFFALLMLGIASAYDNDWKGKDLIVLLLIFSYTITLSLGSDTDISRKTTTLVFVIPLIYVSAKMAKLQAQRILISCMVCIVAVYSMIYFTLPMRNSYADIKYINQTMPVSELGIKQKIKVDPYIYDEIKQLKDAGLSNSSVVLNSSSSWGFVYLLGCKPVSYSFNLYEDKVIESLKKNSFGIKLVLVEEKPEKPFTTEFKDSVAMLFEAKRCEKKETNRHNLYFFYK